MCPTDSAYHLLVRSLMNFSRLYSDSVSPPVVPGQTCYSLQAMASARFVSIVPISIVIIALAIHLVSSSTCAFSGDLVAVQNSEWDGTTPSARYGHKRPTHVSTPSLEFGKYQRPEEASHFLTWIVLMIP
ncbi:hypothetical protein L210DRAFT_988102 [Boletus edulis BED1]|uniref:Uncharacterized protein n=1 Tax=Boletus edulis BED1 TaxID=1328754 RepID=A0AAD4G762_BOLED|nr:hypothetical protein L210DRAFT_988102 [Boletus edulis BED1]